MKNRLQSFSFLLTLGVVLGLITWGGSLMAQNPPPQTQQASPDQSAPAQQQPSQAQPPAQAPDTSGQQNAPSPEQPPAAQPGQQPSGSQAQTDSSGAQVFTGTIMKQGDKYVLQDAASGTTYDIDHQDEVKKFDGKKVRVHGTLDASGKMIHVQ